MSLAPEHLRIGIDIGGTFTDFVVLDVPNGALSAFKLPSTPADPSLAVLSGLQRVVDEHPAARLILEIVHGSTVATNALLERKEARTAFIATRGFGDLLLIGRQNRQDLYNLAPRRPAPLIPAEFCFEVDERLGAQGEVLQPLADESLEALVSQMSRLSPPVEAAAVCLLYSYIDPAHEQAIARRLRQQGYSVSCSHEVLPEYREYPRASATAINASVSPVFERYLGRLITGLAGLRLAAGGEVQAAMQVMQSNGGVLSPDEARRNGVRCILSGPAGGIIAAQRWANATLPLAPGQAQRLITFDMGGTSTDTAVITGEPRLSQAATVDGLPVGIPILDIHTIGAGGGSIARLDAGGSLRVGPESAGADPGPACYGHGGALPTLTDAHLVIGSLDPGRFLDGQMPIYPELARAALERLGSAMGRSAEEAALGVIQVADAHIERALRAVTVERGIDPRGEPGSTGGYTLISFGGAGGLHACRLARNLGIHQVLIPPTASAFSALGMILADQVRDTSLSVLAPADSAGDKLARWFRALEARAASWPGSPGELTMLRSLDVRYTGQSFELSIPYTPDYLSDFHQAHQQVYGFCRPEAACEIVNLRLRAVIAQPQPMLRRQEGTRRSPTPTRLRRRPVYSPAGWQDVPVYASRELVPGEQIAGLALIEMPATTVVLGVDDYGQFDVFGNLLISIGYAH